MAKKILFVDDDPNFQKMVEIFLRNDNFLMHFAKNGRSALHYLKENKYDLIISDVQMPEMDGITLVEEVKKRHPDLPVIILSAFGHEAMAKKALEKGAVKIIRKPFESKVLINAINENIEKV